MTDPMIFADIAKAMSGPDQTPWVDPLDFARGCHGDQTWGGHPYEVHLLRVASVLEDFGFVGFTWRTAALLHDVAEDCLPDLLPQERRELIAETYGDEVAALVWAVSGFGENRKIRNADIYAKLAEFPKACILKCADRIVNVEQTVADRSRHISMYLKEREKFEQVVRAHVPPAMWTRLEIGFDSLEAMC